MANSDIPSGTNRAELLDDLLALICEFLPDSTLTYVNRAYADYFNTTPDKLLGRRFMDLIPEQYREPLRATYMAATPENPTIRVEHAVWKTGSRPGTRGSTRPFLMSTDTLCVLRRSVWTLPHKSDLKRLSLRGAKEKRPFCAQFRT
ncbi:MAG: PAS domain-containing protein [Kiritimatiellae bacterium]|nr:PAS domain-containing protein [Kiritimatiellia bacterium]